MPANRFHDYNEQKSSLLPSEDCFLYFSKSLKFEASILVVLHLSNKWRTNMKNIANSVSFVCFAFAYSCFLRKTKGCGTSAQGKCEVKIQKFLNSTGIYSVLLTGLSKAV